MISINWATKVITVPQADLTFVSGSLYELNVNTFRLILKDLEDDANGMPFLRTHNHNTEVTVGGVTLARVIEIINGYTITFENGNYAVRLVGANNNIPDVVNVNSVSIRSNNSTGLVVADDASALWSKTIENGISAEGVFRILLAVAAGRTDIAGNVVTFRDQANTKDRITATMSGSERSNVVNDPT